MTDNGRKERRLAGFVIDNHLSAGSIITALTVLVGAVVFILGLRGDIERNTERIDANRRDIVQLGEQIKRAEDRTQKAIDRVIRTLERIEKKIDTKADKE